MSGRGRPVVFFGTYDDARHPRIRVLREALEHGGVEVIEINESQSVPTSRRVAMLRRPWLAALPIAELARAWISLGRRARRLEVEPRFVVVGYLGVLDVHLARRLFSCPIVLDHLAPVAETAMDRGLPGRRLLALVDRAAVRAADAVIVDTASDVADGKHHVVPVGASRLWFERRRTIRTDGPLRVVFFGLFTPLQGCVHIAGAIERCAGRDDIEWTLVGSGQDAATVDRVLESGGVPVRRIDHLPIDELATEVARHHVCLGIFGTGDKARRVVPNKVYQGASAGCAVVTSDTPNQRRTLGTAAVYVPAGDSQALAAAICKLADDRDELAVRMRRMRAQADAEFGPAAIAHRLGPLLSESD